MGLRGPVKQFHKEARIDLTELQFTYLRTAAVNNSVAAVVRELIQADLERRLQEAANARRGRRHHATDARSATAG
jgi:hypothetical protein